MSLAFVVVLAGLALVPLPGPGWAIVFIGLGMLALEFEWAENLMEKVLNRLEAAQESAPRTPPRCRRRSGSPPRSSGSRPSSRPRSSGTSRCCRSRSWVPAAGRAWRRRCGRRGGGRGVLELLLGAEQRVEHLLAQALGDGERDAAADDVSSSRRPKLRPFLCLGASRSATRRVAERLGGVLEVLLQLLVVEDLLRRRLAVAEASGGVARGLVGLHMFSRSSSSSITRCTYGVFLTATAAAPALAAFFFAAMVTSRSESSVREHTLQRSLEYFAHALDPHELEVVAQHARGCPRGRPRCASARSRA